MHKRTLLPGKDFCLYVWEEGKFGDPDYRRHMCYKKFNHRGDHVCHLRHTRTLCDERKAR